MDQYMEENVTSLGMWILENEPTFFKGSLRAYVRLFSFLMVTMLITAIQFYITFHFYKTMVADSIRPLKI